MPALLPTPDRPARAAARAAARAMGHAGVWGLRRWRGPWGLLSHLGLLRLAAWCVTAGVTAAVAVAAPDRSPPPSPWSGPLTRCHLDGLPPPARCASLWRPLDAAAPGGAGFWLHYAVLPAVAQRKAPDPVVFLVGGPGQSAVDLAGVLAARFARLGQRRDLVFIDQRGTGRSAPLRCADDAPQAALMPLAQALDLPGRLDRLAQCRQALQALPHGDLRHYTTAEAAADLEAVRQALGVAQWNVVAFSYGTRLALEHLRQSAPAVRRMVLDGVVPPDMRLADSAAQDNAAAWQAVLDACRTEPACQRRHPDLAAQWAMVLRGLPRQVLLAHPVSGQPQPVQLTRAQVLGAVRGALYAPWLAAALPEAVAQAAQGRFQALMTLSAALAPGGLSLASGMHFSVVCSEDIAAPAASAPVGAAVADANRATVPGPDLAQVYRQVCAAWPRGQVPAGFNQVAASPAPVWLLSGGLDPVTPPRHGARMAQALGPLARHSVVPAWGHGVLALGCAGEALQRFVAAPVAAQAAAQADAALADCAAGVGRPPAFVAPGAAPTAGGRS